MKDKIIEQNKGASRFEVSIYVSFAILILIVLVGGFFVYRNIDKELKESIHNELGAVSQLKRVDLSEWYIDELADAEAISENYFLISLLEQVENEKSTRVEQEINNILEIVQTEHSYSNVCVLNENYEPLYYTNYKEYPDSISKVALRKVILLDKIISTDLHYFEQQGQVSLKWICPLKTEGRKLGYLVLGKDPKDYLFPRIQRWPYESNTAETVIVRSETDSVVYLNELRHDANTELNFKVAKTESKVPAVYAVDGFTGIFEGVDYFGKKVVAFVDKIPGTPWFMVSKIDKAEIYQSLYRNNLFFALSLVLLLIILFVFLALFIINSRKKIFKNLFLANRKSETILYSIGECVITTNKDGIVDILNAAGEKLTGWSEEDARGKKVNNIVKIYDAKLGSPIENPVDMVVKSGKSIQFSQQTVIEVKGGRRIPVIESASPLIDPSGRIDGVVLIFKDQSEEINHKIQLEHQKKQLSALLANLPGMAYRCRNDVNWTMEFVSEGCLDLTGYEASELEENNIMAYSDLIHHEDNAMVWEEVQKAINEDKRFELQYRIITKDGQEKWVLERGTKVSQKDSGDTKLEGFITDITMQVKYEQALKESEKLFQTLAVNATVGIFRTDADGNTTYVNPEWCKLSGMTEEEALNDGWLKMVHPDDKARLIKHWRNDVSKVNDSEAEYRFIHPDGKVVFVKGRAVPELNDQNEITGFVGTITDVTLTKEAEEKLVQSNKFLRTIIDNIPDAIYLKDLEGRKLLANKADIINIGANSEAEIIGKTDFDYFPLEIANKLWEDDLLILKNKKQLIHVEEEIINLKGDRKWLATTKIEYLNAKGEVIGLIGIGRDVTTKREMELDLIRAKENAEKAEHLKTAFLANMSHEIRTPLNSILGFVSLMNYETGLSEKDRLMYTEIINKNSEALLQIINDIIDISSLETHQLVLHPGKVNLQSQLNILFHEFRNKIKENKKESIELRLIEVDESFKMEVDANRLNQILNNLLTNALKFTVEGYVEFGVEKVDDKFVHFKVEDTGIGIGPDQKKLIFERFIQADNNYTRRFGGNGLGLSIVKSLVELMGGEISLETELKKGSVFRFSLPVKSVN